MAHLTVVATFKAKPACADRLLALLQGLIAPTRAEAGCINDDLHRSADEPDTFLFHENWHDRAAWDVPMQAPHLRAFGEAYGELAESWTLFAGHRVESGS